LQAKINWRNKKQQEEDDRIRARMEERNRLRREKIDELKPFIDEVRQEEWNKLFKEFKDADVVNLWVEEYNTTHIKPSTQKQMDLLKKLGFDFEVKTMREASQLIGALFLRNKRMK
jgi:hypothetical protein